MQFQNRQEQKEITEKMNSLLLSLQDHLDEKTKDAVKFTLRLLADTSIKDGNEHFPIYVIGTGSIDTDANGNQYLNISRIPGWYPSLKVARERLTSNDCDLWETCYDYGVIEKIYPGLYKVDLEPEFYCYDKETGKYIKIKRPKEAGDLCGFTIG